MGSGFDEWVYWHFFTITVEYNSSHTELLLNTVCLTNLYEEFLTNLGLISTATLEFTNALLSITATWPGEKSSYLTLPLFCCHENVFVNIRCCGNKCLLSRCLARMTSSSYIIPAFRQCLPSRCLANDHIPS
jgi:hypothetical protein